MDNDMIYVEKVSATNNNLNRFNNQKHDSYEQYQSTFKLVADITTIIKDYEYSFIDDSTIDSLNNKIRNYVDNYNSENNHNIFEVLYDDIEKKEFESSIRLDMGKHIRLKHKSTGEVIDLKEYVKNSKYFNV